MGYSLLAENFSYKMMTKQFMLSLINESLLQINIFPRAEGTLKYILKKQHLKCNRNSLFEKNIE